MAEKAAEGNASGVGDRVFAADGHHEPVVTSLVGIIFPHRTPEHRVDIDDDVLRRGFRGLLGGLNDLRNRSPVFKKPDAVAGNIEIVKTRTAHVPVNFLAAGLAFLEIGTGGKTVSLDTTGPHLGGGVDNPFHPSDKKISLWL